MATIKVISAALDKRDIVNPCFVTVSCKSRAGGHRRGRGGMSARQQGPALCGFVFLEASSSAARQQATGGLLPCGRPTGSPE